MSAIWAITIVVIKEMYRRKDFYVLFILTILIALVLGSVNVFDDNRIVRYLKEITLLLIWIATLVMAVTMAARQIPMEKANRTMLPLLAKPVSRAEVVLGKFLGCWLASGVTILVFYIAFMLLTGRGEEERAGLSYAQGIILHWWFLGIVIAATLLGSLALSTPSSNVTLILILTVGILFLGRHLDNLADGMTEPLASIVYLIYFVIPHLEFFDVRERLIHSWPPLPWGILIMALAYGMVYGAIFLLGTWALFRKKPVVGS